MTVPEARQDAIPVTLLTGYLGSGKTTLLNGLLAEPQGMKAAVVVNEFGEVGLDHLLARPVEGTSIVVKNGCICCTVHEDLRRTLRDLMNARDEGEIPAFDRLLIETSGVTEPMPVIFTLHTDPMFRHAFRLEGIVNTVDALAGYNQVNQRSTAARQVSMADHVVITKTDLQDAAAVDFLEHALSVMVPEAHLHRVPGGAGLWDAVMAPVTKPLSLSMDATARSEARLHDGVGALKSFSFAFETCPDWSRFAVWLSLLMHRHGSKLLRIKGLLDVPGHDGPMVLNAIQNYIHPPVHLESWPGGDHRSRLVFITEGLEKARIRAALEHVVGARTVPLTPIE